ncbi:MAG TPA: hypothetical protein V6C78_06060, partial [Crinalium sp.]
GFLGIVVFVWAIISLRRWGILKAANQFHQPPQPTNQTLPCSNCRFLSHNSYLRCAVHPSKVLKSEAMQCPDYWAQDSDRFRDSTYK